MPHWYLPSGGQADANQRSLALGLAVASPATAATYSPPSLPCAVCDHDGEIIYTPEPTTFNDVWETHDDLVRAAGGGVTVGTVATNIAAGIASHSTASNPHNITPAGIGAATSGHNHDAAYATTGHSHAAQNDPRVLMFASSADQSVTGTSVTDVTGLAFAVAANSTYAFTMWVDLTASGGTSPTHNYQFTGPAVDRFMAKRTQMTSASAQSTSTVTALATGFGAGATVANIKSIFEGIVKTGANAGTIQLRVTPAGTTPTSTIGRGSGGYAMKLA